MARNALPPAAGPGVILTKIDVSGLPDLSGYYSDTGLCGIGCLIVGILLLLFGKKFAGIYAQIAGVVIVIFAVLCLLVAGNVLTIGGWPIPTAKL